MFTMRDLLTITSATCVKELSRAFEWRTKRTVIGFWIISILLTVISYWLELYLVKDNYELVSRSGSLIVVLFVGIEFRLYRHIARYERILSTGYVLLNNAKLKPDEICSYCESYLSHTRLYRYALAIGGLIGTLIWGYASLL
jgi:hypothetical protein